MKRIRGERRRETEKRRREEKRREEKRREEKRREERRSLIVLVRYYIQRPEAVESFFYLYRTTGEEKYRTYGWEVITAINKTCRVADGFR